VRPKSFDRNLVVIGAGAGGLVTAYIAAAVKAKVTLVEAHKMGGDCLNYGCVPSKALIRTAKLAAPDAHSANGTAWPTRQPRSASSEVMAAHPQVIADIAAARQRGALHQPGRGRAAGLRQASSTPGRSRSR
jgi:pyruvate/2-oxoglutarate dehydrogenase complex dihydrolipoamide dehydrogenase (E3) component